MIKQAYISTKEAAAYLGLSPRTLEGLRYHGGGPVYYQASRRCFYRQEDLDTWMLARVKTSTSDPGTPAVQEGA